MDQKAKPIPDGFRTVTPYLIVKNGQAAIEFYKKAFAAEEFMRMMGPDGKSIMHAEIRIGDSIIMLCEEFPGEGCGHSPSTLKGTTVAMHLYVEDADAFYKRAVEAGAKPSMPPMDAFWGDRFARVEDPFGHGWSIATHQEDLTQEEMARRAEAFFSDMKK